VSKFIIEKIISGGQTGVDRAALDVALELAIPCGGWCPKGRHAEDGTISKSYPLEEASSSDYPLRTELNVQDADGTLILSWGRPVGGTLLTLKLAGKHRKPFLLINLEEGMDEKKVRNWIRSNGIQILNVAGPRESEAHGIYSRTVTIMRKILAEESHSLKS
jgi:predicted Rossmann-fold nucleotide-binding protein